MKFQTTPAFDRDFKRLAREHQRKFRDSVGAFHDAAVRAAAGQDNPWPRALRVKPVRRVHGVWECTWSKDNPDGRATWEWIELGGEPAIRWRRVGDHRVLDDA